MKRREFLKGVGASVAAPGVAEAVPSGRYQEQRETGSGSGPTETFPTDDPDTHELYVEVQDGDGNKVGVDRVCAQYLGEVQETDQETYETSQADGADTPVSDTPTADTPTVETPSPQDRECKEAYSEDVADFGFYQKEPGRYRVSAHDDGEEVGAVDVTVTEDTELTLELEYAPQTETATETPC